MPPMRSRPFGLRPAKECTWRIGSDDFAIGAFFGILLRLVLLGLTVGTIIYLLFPSECDGEDNNVPPLLYSSLLVFNLTLFFVLISDAIILSISLRGRIHDNTMSRRHLPRAVELRVVLNFVELVVLIVTTVGVFSPAVGGEAVKCKDYRDGPLVFAKVITCIMWVALVVGTVYRLISLDPLGCCSPGLLAEVEDLGELGNETDEEGFLLPGKVGKEGDIKRQKRRYHTQLGHRKLLRRFRALCCCIGAGGGRSTSVALSDTAKAFHTVFSDLDLVTTDILAGLVLLHNDQKRKKRECKCPVCVDDADGSCQSLTKDLRDVTFEYMPECQKPNGYVRQEQKVFDFTDPEERTKFDDIIYYMHYSLGIYGWTLHVFQKPFTGLFRLSAVTCCRCQYSCLNARAEMDFVKDNCCLCGVGTMGLSTKRRQEDIVFAHYGNEVYQAPFSITVDHDMKSVVLAVRGTLSMKDALTDLSVTMVKVKIPGLDSDELYMHNGIYRTAQWIKSQVHTRQRGENVVMSIAESCEHVDKAKGEATIRHNTGQRQRTLTDNRRILRATMEKYWDYQLVVTGHSLGAGVASILAVLLKPAYPDLVCYVYSPPGCLFSLPVAAYSESFITSVVLGNDLIPRASFRSLMYLRKQIEFLLKECKKPKPQVLFQPRWSEKVFSKVTENPTVHMEDVKESLVPTKRTLGFRQIALAKKFAKKAKQNLRRKSTVHVYVKNISQGDHIASFPPGRMLHLEIAKNAKKCCLGVCYPSQMKATWKSFEDFSTLIVDKGIVEDHLPTEVMAALKRCHKQYVRGQYDPAEIEKIRERRQEEYSVKMYAEREASYVGTGGKAWWEKVKTFDEEVGDTGSRVSNEASQTDGPREITVTVDFEGPSRSGPLAPGYAEGEVENADTESVTVDRSESNVSGEQTEGDAPALTPAASRFVQALMPSNDQPAHTATTDTTATESTDVVLEMETISPTLEDNKSSQSE